MTFKTIDEFREQLLKPPLPEDIKVHQDGSKYIPISIIQKKLDDIFPVWSWDLDREFFGQKAVTVKGTLTLLHPILCVEYERSGTAGVVRIGGPAKAAEIRMDYPRAETMCMLNAAKKLGPWFGRDLNRDKEDAPIIQLASPEDEKKVDEQVNEHFENAKALLSKIEDFAEAQKFLNSSGFKYNVELKEILKSKKPKK